MNQITALYDDGSTRTVVLPVDAPGSMGMTNHDRYANAKFNELIEDARCFAAVIVCCGEFVNGYRRMSD